MQEKKRNNYINIFNIDISQLEMILVDWEYHHIHTTGKSICDDIECMGGYLMAVAAYKFRLKVEKKKNLVSLFGFEKIRLRDDNLFCVSGMTVRRLNKGDIAVLMNDFPGFSYKYQVEEIQYHTYRNGVRFFSSKLRFLSLENFQNN